MRTYSTLLFFLSILSISSYANDNSKRDPAMESLGPKVIQETVVEPEKGPVNVEFTYIGDLGRNFLGGGRTGSSFLGVGALRTYVNSEHLLGLKGNSLFFHLQGTHGNVPTLITQDAQVASNIEAYSDTVRIMEFWTKQTFYNDRLQAIFGLFDLNSEFYLTESSAFFVNSSFGLGAELAQVGPDGRTASTFPVTSLAFLLKYQSEEIYVDLAAFDANPGEMTLTGTRIKHDTKKEGYLLISEFGWKPNDHKLAAGAWTYTKKFRQIDDSGESKNYGSYFLGEYKLSKNLTAFLRFGVSADAVNQFNQNIVAGVTHQGVFDREEDSLGLGIAQVQNSSAFKKLSKQEGSEPDSNETVFELTYQYKYSEHLTLQPDIQYIVNPGIDPELDNALVGFLRIQIDY